MFEDVDEGHLDGETPVHYYYNREERLSKAPDIVKKYYSGELKPFRGFQALYKNKSNLSILIALIFFVGFTWVYTGINNSRNYAKIDNIIYELQAFSYGEEVYASIKVSSKVPVSNPSPATVEYFFINNDKQLIQKETQSILFTGEEDYLKTKTTDYDIMRVDVIISCNGKEKELSTIIRH